MATVTDANVVLGRIPTDLRLGGSIKLEIGAARRALAVLGSDLGLEIDEVAAGVIEVVDTHMERALRAVSVEEGVDPRDSVLVAFGGAGGLHATRLARRLGMRTTLIPPLSGVFSALGLLLAEPSSDAGRTVMLEEGSDRLRTVTGGISEEANATFTRDHGTAPTGNEAWADVRYAGQSHELAVPLADGWDGLRQDFEDLHQARFGFIRTEEPIELVNVRAEATGPAPMTWEEIPPISAGKGNPGPQGPGHPRLVPGRASTRSGDRGGGDHRRARTRQCGWSPGTCCGCMRMGPWRSIHERPRDRGVPVRLGSSRRGRRTCLLPLPGVTPSPKPQQSRAASCPGPRPPSRPPHRQGRPGPAATRRTPPSHARCHNGSG